MTKNIQKPPDEYDDHYISKTYLRRFSDQNKHKFVWEYSKKFPDKGKFVSVKSICFKVGGDYNPHCANNRPLDDFYRYTSST